jgi:hypothetical protein
MMKADPNTPIKNEEEQSQHAKSMKQAAPQPNETGEEVGRKVARRISGRSNLAIQVMQQNNGAKADLPRIFEDKSNHFSKEFFKRDEVKEAEEALAEIRKKLYIGDGKSLCDANGEVVKSEDLPAFRHAGRNKYVADFYEIASISTIGNGTHFNNNRDEEVPNRPEKRVSSESEKLRDQPWVIKQYPNEPHPLLDYPPLYFLLRNCPSVLETIKAFYQARWRMAYPLQRRVFFSQQLRKLGIFMTWGELILVLPFLAMIVGGIILTFIYPSVFWSGHVARLALIFALATGVRNSIITLLIGLPFGKLCHVVGLG